MIRATLICLRKLVAVGVDAVEPPVAEARRSDLAEDARFRDLACAVGLAAADPDLLLRFVRDRPSWGEIRALANRWAAAEALLRGESQVATARRLRLADKTVAALARRVRGPPGVGGYREVFRHLENARGAPHR